VCVYINCCHCRRVSFPLSHTHTHTLVSALNTEAASTCPFCSNTETMSCSRWRALSSVGDVSRNETFLYFGLKICEKRFVCRLLKFVHLFKKGKESWTKYNIEYRSLVKARVMVDFQHYESGWWCRVCVCVCVCAGRGSQGSDFYAYLWGIITMYNLYITHLKSSDAKASKCHLKFSSLMMIFIKQYIQVQ